MYSIQASLELLQMGNVNKNKMVLITRGIQVAPCDDAYLEKDIPQLHNQTPSLNQILLLESCWDYIINRENPPIEFTLRQQSSELSWFSCMLDWFLAEFSSELMTQIPVSYLDFF